jgi:hypothetical protein
MSRKDVHEVIAGMASGKTGWTLVESMMETQIENGLTNEKEFLKHWSGEPHTALTKRGGYALRDAKGNATQFYPPNLMPSWKHFSDWKRANPDKPVPREINRIRDEGKFNEWARDGFPG